MSKQLKKTSLVGMVMLFLAIPLFAQPPDILWTKTYGGEGTEEGYTVLETSDGGYIISGWTTSYGAGEMDVYLIKTDADGNLLWEKTFGGESWDQGLEMCQTSDGGYAITGKSASFNMEEEFEFPAMMFDAYLVKTDADGNLLWEKTYGGESMDQAFGICETADSGLIFTGSSNDDVYLVKTDAEGEVEWEKTYGGERADWGQGVSQTTDGGYIISGWTNSYGAGEIDAYFIKTDASGDTLWTSVYGGVAMDFAGSVCQNPDGSYIASGMTASFGEGRSDMWLIKLDANGDSLWTKTYGGEGSEVAFDYCFTPDGGCVIAAMTDSYGSGEGDAYLVKIDAEGNLLWEKTMGGEAKDGAYYVTQTADGGFIVTGWNASEGAGAEDVYLVKLGPDPGTGGE